MRNLMLMVQSPPKIWGGFPDNFPCPARSPPGPPPPPPPPLPLPPGGPRGIPPPMACDSGCIGLGGCCHYSSKGGEYVLSARRSWDDRDLCDFCCGDLFCKCG